MTDLGLAAFAMLAAATGAPEPGVYSNEEQVYFERDAGRTPPQRLTLKVADGRIEALDAFGAPAGAFEGKVTAAGATALTVALPSGATTMLRRARPATCWAALLKDARKPDGTEDWAFQPGLKLHDQGGRARAATAGAKPAVLRVRNVVWPSGPNRPSLVLYIHTPDEPERAVAYSWADPGAVRIGINLRWMQASCTIDGAEETPIQRRETE